MKSLALYVPLGLVAASSFAHGKIFFKEEFPDDKLQPRWVKSLWNEDGMGEWEISHGDWYGDSIADLGLRTSQDLKFFGISSRIPEPFSNRGKDLVVQFSVKHEGLAPNFCSGGYIKLMGKDVDQVSFKGATPYSIMFGPDMCGQDPARIHLIFNYKGENLLKKEDIAMKGSVVDEFTHLYTLHLRPDNSYTVYVDNVEQSANTLADGWDIPSLEINDPTDVKPADWVDNAMIPDPNDVKPTGYDDIPESIADPDSVKPEDWNVEDDGEWEPRKISNPEFKGKWVQKEIENPEYKGEWKPKQIPNPDYDPEAYAFDDIGTVGFELWVVNKGSIFDNIFIGDSLEEAKAFAAETWEKTKVAEIKAKRIFDDEYAAKVKLENDNVEDGPVDPQVMNMDEDADATEEVLDETEIVDDASDKTEENDAKEEL